jgi:hypothetical protein
MVRIGENYLSAVLQVIGELSLLWHVVAGHDVGVVRCRGTREGEKWSGGGQEGGSHGCRFRPARHAFCLFNSSTDVGTGYVL